MYGGDEVAAIVLDLGSHTCKAGYAGEDAPKAYFPSVVGSIDQVATDALKNEGDLDSASDAKAGTKLDSEKSKAKRKFYVGSQDLGFRRDHMEVLPALKDGIVMDWDIVDSIWDHAFRKRLMIDPKEHPILLAEPSFNLQQQREKTAEIMFENHNVPALFLAKNAVLTSFASGRATSLVVDCGGGSTTVAAVNDGYVLQKAVLSSPIGGEVLTDCLLRTLEKKDIVIRPRYSFKKKEIRLGEFKILLQVTRPHAAVLGKIPGTNIFRNVEQYADATEVPGVLVVRVDSAIYFSNANYIRERYLEDCCSSCYGCFTV